MSIQHPPRDNARLKNTLPIPALTDKQSHRFFEKVSRSPGCWIWTGAKNSCGYGYATINSVRYLAHRVSYVIHRGEIPEGLVIDHLCRTPLCVNPSHLEVVTDAENTIRGNSPIAVAMAATHCKHGHEFSGDNLRIVTRKGKSHRRCRTCDKVYRGKPKLTKTKDIAS